MQRFKCFLAARRSLHCNSTTHFRTISALPNYATVNKIEDDVLVEGKAYSRSSILNRPDSLNALTTPMVGRLNRLYESWEENPDIGFVLMKNNGRAFSSGSDVVSLYNNLSNGNVEDSKVFFQTLYKFVYLLGTYFKPHVAILNGLTFGAGAGISFPGMFRVVTDKTVFATPEAQIGFHPDAGASFYLSRLPGYLGEYLALTGEKLNGVEMVACGLATHYALKERLPMIDERLSKLMTDDTTVIENSLAQYGDLVYLDETSVLNKIESIDKCFSQDTVEEILDALEKEAAESHSEWSTTAIKKLKEASPLSLKVTLQSVTVLLKECRDIQLRCGSANNDIDGDAMINCADQITVESDAQRIISERLVNFKDINGLVERNTQLRSLVRRLLDQIKNREAELKEPIAPYDDVAYIFFKDYEKGGWFISFTRVACYPFGQPENFSYCHMGRVQKEAKGSAR